MEDKKSVAVSKYDRNNKMRRKLVKKCIADPSDLESLEALLRSVHPIAYHVMHEHRNHIPSMDKEDYIQLADIVVWRVIRRIRIAPDIINSFEAYLIKAIRNKYIDEYRKFVFKNYVEIVSFERSGSSLAFGYYSAMKEYVELLAAKRNAYVREFRRNNTELCRQRERDYWFKNKDKKREKDKRYYEKHKSQIAARNKEYRATHKEQRNARDRKYRAEHPEETRAKRREYYHQTIEHQHEYRRAYDEAHREKKREYSKRYFEKNKEEILAKNREYKRNKRAELKRIGSKTDSIEGDKSYD